MTNPFPIKEDHKNIRNEDWRLQAISTLAKDFTSPWTGTKHPKGTAIAATSILMIGKDRVAFKSGNFPALFLDFAYKLWADTVTEIEKREFLVQNPRRTDPNSHYVKDEKTFFDLLEKRMAAVVFAYSAIEAFSNQTIPDQFVYQPKKTQGKYMGKYDKEGIERYVLLDTKLGDILPEILNLKSPRGTKIWASYLLVKGLRDSIIHLKSSRKKDSTVSQEISLVEKLLQPDLPNVAVVAREVIGYFLDGSNNQPRWYKIFKNFK